MKREEEISWWRQRKGRGFRKRLHSWSFSWRLDFFTGYSIILFVPSPDSWQWHVAWHEVKGTGKAFNSHKLNQEKSLIMINFNQADRDEVLRHLNIIGSLSWLPNVRNKIASQFSQPYPEFPRELHHLWNVSSSHGTAGWRNKLFIY